MDGTNPVSPATVGVEQRREDARRLNVGETAPVNGSVAAHKTARLQVADQAILTE